MFYRLGQAMVRLRYWVIGLWLIAALASIPFAPRVAQALSPGGFSSPDMQSQQAIDALQSGLHTSFTTVLVIFSSKTMTAEDPRFIAQATAATAKLQGWSAVSQVVPFTLDPSQISRDHHTAFTSVFLTAGADAAPRELPALRQRITPQPDLNVTIGGGPVFYADIQSVSEADLRRAEMIAFPFALLALLLVFRSVVAAALPAIIGGCSVAISLALLYAIALHTSISIFALNITTLFGLGLGVDYSLFVVSRFREELRRGHTPTEAVAVSMETAGRAVFFSGLTVSIGLLGLVVFPLNMLHSVGLGGMLTVAFSIVAAVTLLPALLGTLGERVNALPVRLPRFGRTRAADYREEHGFWHGLSLWVMRRPVLTLLPTLGFLLLLGTPFLSVRLAAPDASILPQTVKSRAAFDTLNTQFDQSETTPIVMAVETTGSPLEAQNVVKLDQLVRRIEADGRVARVTSIVSLDPRLTLQQYELMYSNPRIIADPYINRSLAALAGDHITLVQVYSKYGMLDSRSESLVQAIRAAQPPSGMRVLVDGGTAGIIDYVNTLYGAFPYALLLIALITYIVLALLFRSLVLPLKAIVMNMLSILASYGALVFIFQQGHFSHLLNFTPLGYVEASSPILMFCALFGLSMDYEVFLLSRIREAHEQTGDNTRSVALGLERSGGIITSAAAIVILVSAAFASADMVIVKALGVGMALAVLLDATLVRGLLAPATMRLLGEINWWWPWPFNRWLPAHEYREASAASGTPLSEQAGDSAQAPTGAMGGPR
ncbi:MAG TPA: MMPL family transporter [Ktedonobacterales bacterium]|nr:MMPL family transporter [Ktedonobacterales bacterium]